MFVVRVYYRNREFFNFLYVDPSRAKSCAEDLATAKMRAAEQRTAKEHQVHVFDDAGREAWIDGGQVQCVMMVDANREVYLNTRMAITVQRAEAHFLQLAGVTPPQKANGAGASGAEDQPSPSIGRAPNFAT